MHRMGAYPGQRSKDPFKFEHLELKRAVLDVGGTQYEETFDFTHDVFYKLCLTLLNRLKNCGLPINGRPYWKYKFFYGFSHFSRTVNSNSDITSQRASMFNVFRKLTRIGDAYPTL